MGQTSSEHIETDSLTATHWLAVLLVLATGIVHVYAGLVEGRIPVSLAGVGFLGAVVLFLLNYRRSLLYPVGVVYTAVQFPLWYVASDGQLIPELGPLWGAAGTIQLLSRTLHRCCDSVWERINARGSV